MHKSKAKRSHSKEPQNRFHVEKCVETKTKCIGHTYKYKKAKITY